jgi:hypothetical protein
MSLPPRILAAAAILCVLTISADAAPKATKRV